MLPFREFTDIAIYMLYAHDPDSHNYDQASDWDLVQTPYGMIGERCNTVATDYEYWVTIFKPRGSDWREIEGMDRVADVRFNYVIALDEESGAFTEFGYRINTAETSNVWTDKIVSRFYDGVNQWDSYGGNGSAPPEVGTARADAANNVPIAGFGAQNLNYWKATWFGANWVSNNDKTEFYQNGFGAYLFTAGFDVALSTGDKCIFSFTPHSIRVRFVNPVVNSLSRYVVPEAGGVPLIINGICFDPTDAELSENGTGGTPVGGFDAFVTKVKIIGQQGQGTTTLIKDVDFTVTTDRQITIEAMPPLALGTYEIQLTKWPTDLAEFDTYAGDWRADVDGRVYQDERIVLRVGPTSDPDYPETPIILTDWKFRGPAGDIIDKRYAEIDVRSTNYFWEGRILNMDALTRSVDDLTGMYRVSDMSIILANNDKEFSKLLAQYMLKNQIVGVYQLYGGGAAEQREYILRMIVHDHDIIGDQFVVYLKDITDKFFATRDPEMLLTEDEYPNIHASAVGKAAPHGLGINALYDDAAPGAIEARYIDTVNYKYLAAFGSLSSVDEVYSDGVLKTEGAGSDYVISYSDGGRTYIVFNADQGENKITFNSHGYIFDDYTINSGEICVVNPAYVLLFYLAFLRKIPVDFIDFDSFHELADHFEDSGYGDIGRLIIQEETDALNNVREYLMTFGIKMFPAQNGKLTVVKKDETNIATDIHILEQIHAKSSANRKSGLTDIVNLVRSKFDYYPTASQFVGAVEQTDDISIDYFGVQMESDTPFEMKWTTSESFIATRLSEILRQRAYGYKTLTFTIEFDWINQIDITDNFKFQNPFGLDVNGDGERGRYYYIDQMTYNWHEKTISIHAIDLQWLISQYFILGNRSALADLWPNASEQNKIYGYLCDRSTNAFSTGDRGKRLSER